MIKLTIIIPAFNVEKFILNALNSIKLQEVNPSLYQVLIVDDGSFDSSANLIKHWINSNNLKNNFKYIYKENGNWGSVINYVKNKKLIKGEYVTILDADDYFNDNCFSIIFPYLDGHKDLIISNYYQNKNGKLKIAHVMFGNTSKQILPEEAHTGYSIPLCKFYKSSLFYKMPDLRENISFQDQILYHAYVLKSKDIFFINLPLGVYWFERIGSSSASLWTDKKVKIWAQNMNTLLSFNSKSLSSYVLMMIWFAKKNMLKKQREIFIIKNEYQDLLKKSNFFWLPKHYRWIAKVFFNISTKSILKTSNRKK